MNPRFLTGMGVTAAAAAAVLCWYLLSREPDSAPRTVGKGLAPAAGVTGHGAYTTPETPLPKFGSPDFDRVLRERGMAWLNARGRDATGLITIFDLTRDYMLLEEAEERFPESPRVVIAVAQLPEVTWNKELIEHLRAVDPQNPEWIYQKLRLLSELDREAVLAVLRKAASLKGRCDYRLAERMQRLQETCLVLGVGPGDAVRLTLARQSNYSNLKAIVKARLSLVVELKTAQAAGSEEGVREIIDLALVTAEKFSAPLATDFGLEQSFADLKLDLLPGLPDDMMIGASEKPVGTVRAEAQERIGIALRFMSLVRERAELLLRTASDEVAMSYFNLYMRSGDIEAGQWLVEQNRVEQSKKAQGTEAAAGGDAE